MKDYDCPKCRKGTLWRWSGTDQAECDNCDFKELKYKKRNKKEEK